MEQRYGVDVAATRLDDLDKKLLAAVATGVARGWQPAVLDLGCGSGGLAAELARAGAVVTAVDTVDCQAAISARNTSLPKTAAPIDFIWSDALTFCQQNTVVYDYVACQRTLHYLPYVEAVALLEALKQSTDQLYISVTGAESEIGQVHPLRQAPLFERFACVSTAAQAQFSLTAPLCVYTFAEFSALLLETGWQIDTHWTSLFGNHKTIATPRTD